MLVAADFLFPAWLTFFNEKEGKLLRIDKALWLDKGDGAPSFQVGDTATLLVALIKQSSTGIVPYSGHYSELEYGYDKWFNLDINKELAGELFYILVELVATRHNMQTYNKTFEYVLRLKPDICFHPRIF